MTSPTDTLRPQLDRIQFFGLIAGVVGIVLLAVGAFIDIDQFYQSYLYAYLFWLAFALGPLAALMVQYLTGGRWGLMIRRPLEAGALTLPLMAALFIPILIGIPNLYEWSHEELVTPGSPAFDPIIAYKTPYLNVPFFIGRAVFYFLVWCILALLFNRWSVEQDRTGDPGITARMRMLSGPGIVLYFLAMSFAAFDWGMSLEPHWFSSMYGVLYIIGQGMVALASMIIVMALFGHQPPLSAVTNVDRIHDLGKLLFAFVVLWAYTNFAQYLIIWTGNLPEELPWYIARLTGGWQYVAMVLMAFQFALPFFLLLSRRNKRQLRTLVTIASFLLLMRAVDLLFLTRPAFHPGEFHISWLDFAAMLGIGGLWLALMARNLKSKPLLPLNDERLAAATHRQATGPQEALSRSH